MYKDKKCVIVLSGGLDSSTVAYWAKSQGYQIYPIVFKYGQIAVKEVYAAKKIAENLGTSIKIVDFSALKDIFQTSSLVNRDIALSGEFSEAIIVPFRNAIFLSVAVAYAATVGANEIFYGAHDSDVAFYPDCRRDFYEAFEKAAQLGTNSNISISAPYMGKEKTDLVKAATKLNVPLELTWSCYTDGEQHCGQCESCINRKKAFQKANIADLTKYEY
ncbi:MAG: 7-cyano-7-deazaguanine synthase QueC [Candidatus Bathyarchaeota archaeon]|nr:7-cyano-7-deazaguanine synthase QueC [Candidatus Termiticorpusculum sp.]MCL1970611.1 7-cyano-7-deazaguanine synthase QueC [Candidatus Termiticorpusculum sp.]